MKGLEEEPVYNPSMTKEYLDGSIDKLHRIKTWASQHSGSAAALASVAIMAAWYSQWSTINAETSQETVWAINGTAIAASAIVKYIKDKNKDKSLSEYSDIFSTKKMARAVLVEALARITSLDPVNGRRSLVNALDELKGTFIMTKMSQQSPVARAHLATNAVTRGGFQAGKTSTLPSNTEEAYAIVMRETMYSYLNWYSHRAEKLISGTEGDFKIPILAQAYIVENHPKLVLVNPMLFDRESLNAHTTGLADVVKSLTAMAVQGTVMREHIEAWSSNANGTNQNNYSLPNDMLGYR